MSTLICILRSGGRYGPAHVAALRRSLTRHAAPTDGVIALTDLPLDIPGVRAAPLRHDWPGWWSKIEAFRADLGAGPRLLCDLDTIISGRVDPLFAPGFAALEDFFHKGRASTALMRWRGADLSFIYEAFRADPERWMTPGSCGTVPNAVHGDQVVVDHMLREAGLAPDFFQTRHPDLINFYNPELGVIAPLTIFMGSVKPAIGPDGMLRPPPRTEATG